MSRKNGNAQRTQRVRRGRVDLKSGARYEKDQEHQRAMSLDLSEVAKSMGVQFR